MTQAPERTRPQAPSSGSEPAVGRPIDRVDGAVKTTGSSEYTADRPYPDFFQAVYAATATRCDSSALLPDEIPCEPVDARWAVAVTEPAQRPLLRAALRACLS